MLRFDPFRDIDRLTEQLLGSPQGTTRTPRFMPMDVFRRGENYVLRADLPGVDPQSVDVHVDNNTLTIRAERREEPAEGVQWIASERFSGTYLRQLAIGEGIDSQRISADYDNGVLTVTLPVADRARPRRIEVAATSRPTAIRAETVDATSEPVGAPA